MTIERKITGTTDAATSEAVYVEDVFSTWLYTGNETARTISTGIDLSTKGGMLWIKPRTQVNQHTLVDTFRGASNTLASNLTAAQSSDPGAVTAFGTSGFSLGNDQSNGYVNNTGVNYVSWTFRKQPKFFTCLTYTGDGTSNRQITHDLGSTPGMVIVKCTSNAASWTVWHRSLASGDNLVLNSTNSSVTPSPSWINATSSTTFTVNNDGQVNTNGRTYVAYLFAHDAGGFGAAGTDSVVACGSASVATGVYTDVNLGWEPQFILYKRSTANGGVFGGGNANSSDDWRIIDNMRGATVDAGSNVLFANTTTTEANNVWFTLTNTGFSLKLLSSGGPDTFIYLAIRRGPMKTPTDATKVFAPVYVDRTNNPAAQISAGFPVDMFHMKQVNSSQSNFIYDRLRGGSKRLFSDTTDSETSGLITDYLNFSFASQTSVINTAFGNLDPTYIANAFRRAPGFFDVVCYTGTGSATTVAHNLGVVPELIIFKRRDVAFNWVVSLPFTGDDNYVLLNTTASAFGAGGVFLGNGSGYVAPSTTSISLGSGTNGTNVSGSTYVAYLFSTCAGVSKVGSYTGTGTTKQIACGFSAGARFVLIKKYSTNGPWYVWDTARGIVSGYAPYLLLNSTAAEDLSTDYINPYTSGFEISSSAPADINASGATYIYLAIA